MHHATEVLRRQTAATKQVTPLTDTWVRWATYRAAAHLQRLQQNTGGRWILES